MRVALNPIPGVLMRTGKLGHTHRGQQRVGTQAETEGRGRVPEGRQPQSQGTPGTASSRQELEQARKDPGLQPSDRAGLCGH